MVDDVRLGYYCGSLPKLSSVEVNRETSGAIYGYLGTLRFSFHKDNRYLHVQIKDYVQLLCDTFDLDLRKGIVRSVEFGTVVDAHFPPGVVLDALIRSPHKKTLSVESSAGVLESKYFVNSYLRAKFYDKGAERRAKKKMQNMSQEFRHPLRYEVQILRGLARHLGMHEVRLSDIMQRGVYRGLMNLWYEQYHAVEKKVAPEIPALLSLDGVKDIKQYFGHLGTTNPLAVSNALSLIQLSEYNSRKKRDMRNCIQELSRPQYCHSGDVIARLDEEVQNAYDKYWD
jgi:hypothetical protein